MLNKMSISKFDPVTLGKNESGRGPTGLLIFGHLKRALELLISVRMRPLSTF